MFLSSFLILLWIPSITSAQSFSLPPSAGTILHFADDLYQQNDCFRAITEYKRFLYYYPNDQLRFQISFRIGRCYQRQQKWQLALDAYSRLLQSNPPLDWQRRTNLQSAISAYRADHLIEAVAFSDRLLLNCSLQDSCRVSANLLKGLIYSRQKKWQQAKITFDAVSPQLADLADQGLHLPRRSPIAAGMFSTLMPAAGQIYGGRWKDGLFSLMLISALGWATYQADRDNHQPRLYIFGAATGIFYAGNIYGAIVSAIQFNQKANVNQFRRIEGEIYDSGTLEELFE